MCGHQRCNYFYKKNWCEIWMVGFGVIVQKRFHLNSLKWAKKPRTRAPFGRRKQRHTKYPKTAIPKCPEPLFLDEKLKGKNSMVYTNLDKKCSLQFCHSQHTLLFVLSTLVRIFTTFQVFAVLRCSKKLKELRTAHNCLRHNGILIPRDFNSVV